MPCLEISLPKTDTQTKEKLTTNLTEAFVKNTRFEKEIFGILYHEYEIGQVASGGKMCDGKSDRPYLHMLFYCPRIDRITKQKVVRSFTKAFCDALGKDDWKPVIHICEHPYDNVGVNGELLSDTFEQCRNAKFYYDVKDE